MNMQEILNTIRDNASDIYRERIPEATQNNITSGRKENIPSKITNPNNKSFITELALLDEMFNLLNIDTGTRKLILIENADHGFHNDEHMQRALNETITFIKEV